MLTKTNAVKKSVMKWEWIISELEQGKCAHTRGSCGFCEFLDSKCTACPLKDYCSAVVIVERLFWRITIAIDNQRYSEALPLARELLEAIKTAGAKWVKAK